MDTPQTPPVNNGRRAQVSFGRYTGQAGIQEHDGVTTVAFITRNGMGGLRDGTIEGVRFTVSSIEKSKLVEGMVILTVAAVIE